MSYQYGNNPLQTTNVPNAKYKTMLCRHYQATKQCAIGAKCQFAHGVQEQRSINDPLPASALSALTQAGTMQDMTQKQSFQPPFKIPCKYHAMNYCKNGATCQYMHDPEPQVPQQQYQSGVQTTYNPYVNAYQQQQLQSQAMLINNTYQEPQLQQYTPPPPQPQKEDGGIAMVLMMILGNLEPLFVAREDIVQQLKVAQDQVKAGNVAYGSECIKTIIHSPERTQDETMAYTNIYNNALVYYNSMAQQQQNQQGFN